VFEQGRTGPAAISERPPVLFMLDEVANIAPLGDLPDMLSEGGGQGLQIVACLQDVAQARARWGDNHGLLSKCRTKLVLAGIAESDDLEALSTILGDWDRPYLATSSEYDSRSGTSRSSTSWFGMWLPGGQSSDRTEGRSNKLEHSTQRERQLSPSEVSRIPEGHAILIRNTAWSLVKLLPHHRAEAWTKVKERYGAVVPEGEPDELASGAVGELAPVDELVARFRAEMDDPLVATDDAVPYREP
jgi:hypothetical protein